MIKLKYNDSLEKIMTAVFGTVGIIAIYSNLYLKGFETENILDAIKDTCGLIVVIVVFLVTIRKYRNKKLKSFYEKTEQKITKWASDNKYLISLDEKSTYKGKVYNMICDLSKFGEVEANLSTHIKGAFLYFPERVMFDKEKMLQIKINKSLFKTKYGDDYEKYQGFILGNISDKIKYVFNENNIQTSLSEKEKIDIIFKDMEETNENAERLVAIIEFTKTMLLALS